MLRSAAMKSVLNPDPSNHDNHGTTTARSTRATSPPVLVLALLSILAALTTGCAPSVADPKVAQEEIEAFLETYLPKLADAYSSSDADLLEGLAVPKEIASIRKIIDDLALQGKAIDPTLQSFTVEEVSMASYTIALVTVLEVWDLRTKALGSGTLLQEVPDQRKRVKYQIRRADGGWSVTFRQVVDHDLG